MMEREVRSYRLPDGKVTKSVNRYAKEWKLLSKKLIKALGGERVLIGFDPDLLISHKNSYNSEEYPAWLALRIVELYEMAVSNNKTICKKCGT